MPGKKPSSAKASATKAARISKNKKTSIAKTAQAPKSKKISASATKPQRVAHQSSQRHLSRDERNWGMYCHLAAFAGFIIPFGNIIGPALVWLFKREEFPSVDLQGKEALNFQISMTIYFLVAILLTFVLIGFLLIPLLMVVQVVYIIVASIKAQEGGFYHYPFTMRFLK